MAQVRIFSRNCEDNSAAFPDVAAAVLAAADPSALPLILDCELVAVDRAQGNRLRAFQELATRARSAGAALQEGKPASSASTAAVAAAGASAATVGGLRQRTLESCHPTFHDAIVQGISITAVAPPDSSAAADIRQQPDIGAVRPAASQEQQQQQQKQKQPSGQHPQQVDVCVFAFDALSVGGVDLMARSLRERRTALHAALPRLTPGVVQLAQGVEVQLQLPHHTVGNHGNLGDVKGTAEPAVGPPTVATAHAGSTAVATSEDQVMEYFTTALAAGSEGLMLKLLDGPGDTAQNATAPALMMDACMVAGLLGREGLS
jgi:ATP dependent DNA ligase domain